MSMRSGVKQSAKEGNVTAVLLFPSILNIAALAQSGYFQESYILFCFKNCSHFLRPRSPVSSYLCQVPRPSQSDPSPLSISPK